MRAACPAVDLSHFIVEVAGDTGTVRLPAPCDVAKVRVCHLSSPSNIPLFWQAAIQEFSSADARSIPNMDSVRPLKKKQVSIEL